MLVRRVREGTGTLQWALISKTTGRVLRWFGKKKPSANVVAKAEKEIQYFKHKGRQ